MITDTECGDFWFDNFIIQYIELGLAWAIFITIYIKFSHLITKIFRFKLFECGHYDLQSKAV